MDRSNVIKTVIGIVGFLAGGFIGFLARPSVIFIGQLPFEHLGDERATAHNGQRPAAEPGNFRAHPGP